MLGIILKVILVLSILCAIMMYLVILGASKSKSQYERWQDDQEQMRNLKENENMQSIFTHRKHKIR